MARPRKGVVPPHLRKYLFKKKSSRSSGHSRRGAPMAKKRKSHSRKASYHAAALSITKPLMAFGWGYARQKVLNISAVSSLVSKVPGGAYADNIVFGGGAAAIALLVRPTNAYVRQGLETIAVCEAFNAGQKFGFGASTTASGGSLAVVYN